jgi:hypothetical protein
VVPKEAVPKEAVPKEAVPKEAVPKEAVPKEAVLREDITYLGYIVYIHYLDMLQTVDRSLPYGQC